MRKGLFGYILVLATRTKVGDERAVAGHDHIVVFKLHAMPSHAMVHEDLERSIRRDVLFDLLNTLVHAVHYQQLHRSVPGLTNSTSPRPVR